jgi:hypothetical protein
MTGQATSLRFPQLKERQQTGSKVRCHLLTHGTKGEVAQRLTGLIEPFGEVLTTDFWMPEGFAECEEAQLHTAERIIPDPKLRASLLSWWLAVPGARRTTTPNWDIASTCSVRGRRGLLLIEAKAHDAELRNEERGKPLGAEDGKGVSTDSRRNHVKIGACIQDASLALSEQTHLVWALSRDWNYQMANRFTWARKLTELEIPVILIYLGFIGCEEMRKGSAQRPIIDKEDWQHMVQAHSQPLFPREIWDQEWNVHGQPFIPLIRVHEQILRVPEIAG